MVWSDRRNVVAAGPLACLPELAVAVADAEKKERIRRRVAQIRAVGATNEGGNKEPPGATDFNGGEWRRGQRPIIVDMSAMLTGSSSDKLRLFLS